MLKQLSIFILPVTMALSGCATDKSQNKKPQDQKAQEIVDKAIEAHGGKAYENAAFEFDFRGRHYTSRRLKDRYIYTRSFQDSTGQVTDILVNSSQLTRTINGDTVPLSAEWQSRYGNSVNSVLYFIQLPYGLNDPAVNKKYLGETTIKGKPYHEVEITFDQQGGGKDYEDVFVYWFNKETNLMDYFAYYYNTDETGIRFREAYNQQKVGGIIFQEYVNYAPIDSTTTVYQQAKLFENGGLEELSRIENENLQPMESTKSQKSNLN